MPKSYSLWIPEIRLTSPATTSRRKDSRLPTVTDAAKAAGLHKSTIYKWLQEPGFQAAYRLARREVFVAVVSRLQQVSGEAVQTLREVMTDKSQQGAARVGAAKAVLDYAVKATEQKQIVERIEDLERRATGDGFLRREVA